MLQVINNYFKYYIAEILFLKFYLTPKNVTVTFKETNFTNFYGKIFKKFHDDFVIKKILLKI